MLLPDKGMLKVKLYAEYYQFKEEMLKLPAKDIFSNCYKIGEIWNIYESMLAMAEVLSEEIIQELWEMPSILEHMYNTWLKRNDSHYFELKEHLDREILLISQQKEDV